MRRVKELGNRLSIEIPSEDIRPIVDRLVRLRQFGSPFMTRTRLVSLGKYACGLSNKLTKK